MPTKVSDWVNLIVSCIAAIGSTVIVILKAFGIM